MPTARLTTALQMLSETPTLVCAHGVVGFKWWFLKRSCSHQNGGNFHFAICITLYGGFLKWWYKTTMGFPTKKDPFGVFLRVPPFKETPICHPVFSPYGVREFFFPISKSLLLSTAVLSTQGATHERCKTTLQTWGNSNVKPTKGGTTGVIILPHFWRNHTIQINGESRVIFKDVSIIMHCLVW